jgi:hypothetical protein
LYCYVLRVREVPCDRCQIRKLDIGLNLSNQLDTEKFWGSAFADNLTVIARNNNELRKVLGLIREFRNAAGLVINTDKSEILELCNYKYCVDIGILLVKMAKITGIWFSEDYQLMSDTNWKHVWDNVFRKLAQWKNRQLSLIGKSVIVSSQLLPILMFTGTVLSMPTSMNQELSRGIYKFIWNGNDKEKRALTYQKLRNRGLGLPSLTARL